MRFILAILFILILPNVMKSQNNASATIENATACAGDTLLVPVNVTNFTDIGAMTFFIGYDTNAARFISLLNINPAVTGWLSTNAANSQISIAYSSINAFSIANDKLFDLRFVFLGDSTRLPFLPGTEIANSNLEVIPLDTTAGSIANSINLLQQPDSVKAYPDNDVIFRVTSLGTPEFQWQENNGSGWADLQNNTTYSGVDNDTLFIYDVSLGFNLYEYRCILTAGDCIVTSETGLLEVALAYPAVTIGQASSCPELNVLEPVYAGDLLDMTGFTFNISFDTNELVFAGLENIHPDLQPGNISAQSLLSQPGISIIWNHTTGVSITSGKLFDLLFDYGYGNQAVQFEEGTQVVNSQQNLINATLSNGQVSQSELAEILAQPEADTTGSGFSAVFIVEATGVAGYAWQKSEDAGNTWTDLENSAPYYNVLSDILTIDPAVYSMNGDLFRCVLTSADGCQSISSSAELTVDTLMRISDNSSYPFIRIYPNPFREQFTLVSGSGFAVTSVRIYSPDGRIIHETGVSDLSIHENPVLIPADRIPAGLYLLSVQGLLNGAETRKHLRIIKTDY